MGINRAPNVKLDILGGNGDQLMLDNSGERFTQQYWQHNGSPKGAIWVDSQDSQFEIYGYAGYGTTIHTNATERVNFKSTGEVVFNDLRNDYDFRVANSANANALYIAGNQNIVNVGGTNQATATGFVHLGGIKFSNGSSQNGEFFSWDNEGSTGSQSLIGYWYDGSAYRARMRLAGETGETVFNESSENIDFRVESNTNDHCLFVDASTDQVVIGSSVGSGVTGLSNGKLVINHGNTSVNGIVIYNQAESYSAYTAKASNNTGDRFFGYWVNASGTNVGGIKYSSTGSTYLTTSDLRLKTEIKSIDSATNKLMAMNPVSHKWKADPEADAVHGFIAQEMMEIVPEAVSGDPEGEDMMSMDYGRITPVIVAALQEANKKIMELENRINELEGK